MIEKRYPPERINGPRISLLKHTLELAPKMFDYIAEDRERLAKFLPWPKHIASVDDEIKFIDVCNRSWVNFEGFQFGLFRNNDGEYLGNIGSFKTSWEHHFCEIGYWILGKFEGFGYMREATTCLEQQLRQMGFNRIVIRCDKNNERSKSIPRRLGYKLEGIERDGIMVNDLFCDIEVYSKINTDIKN